MRSSPPSESMTIASLRSKLSLERIFQLRKETRGSRYADADDIRFPRALQHARHLRLMDIESLRNLLLPDSLAVVHPRNLGHQSHLIQSRHKQHSPSREQPNACRAMQVNIPTQVFAECLCCRRCTVARIHGRVMLESVQANELHQLLQLGNLDDCSCAKSVERIVRKLSVAQVHANLARGIVRADPAIAHRPGGRAALQRTYGILFAQHRAKDRCRADTNVGKKILRPVAAMEEDALVRIARRSCCSNRQAHSVCRSPIAERTC